MHVRGLMRSCASSSVRVSRSSSQPVASGWGIPTRWDGRTETLPTGYTQAIIRAVEGREQGVDPDTLVICGAIVTPSLKGRGLAGDY